MEGQISLTDLSTGPEAQELAWLENAMPAMRTAVESRGGIPDLLVRSAAKSYTAVLFCNFTVFRLRLRGKQPYLSIPLLFSDLIPEGAPQKRVSSEPKYIRLLIDEAHPIDFYAPFLAQIAGATVDRYPKEWDCCSRYLECSNAGSCTHPDKAFAMQCGYRKILSSGRIFFGEKRNV